MFRYLVILLTIGGQLLSAGKGLNQLSGHFEGKSPFSMTLEVEGNTVRGVYFYNKFMQDIRISGEITNHGTLLVLRELDQEGKPAAKFEFPLDPPAKPAEARKDSFGGLDFGTDPIEGHWARIGSDNKRRVAIDLEGICGGELDNLYGNREDDQAHARMKLFWDSLKKGDRAKVASCIAFPIKVSAKGKRRSVRNAQELLRIYPDVFYKDYVTEVLSFPPRNLWNNYRGIKLGYGLVWFNTGGEVIAINN